MTLQSRFLRLYHSFTISDEWEGSLQADAEKIADEYAKQVLVTYINSETLQYKQSQGVYSLDELLQIIKKEKGL